MIYYEVHENGPVLRAYRNAYKNDPLVDETLPRYKQMRLLSKRNNMKIHGKQDSHWGWETTGFEFPNEESLTMFLLKWSS